MENSEDDKKIINVTPNASKKELAEKLAKHAEKSGQKLRYFAGEILEKAVEDKRTNKDKCQYDEGLKSPLAANGTPVQCVVNSNAKAELTKWAKSKKRSLGSHCAFIWEKWLEIKS